MWSEKRPRSQASRLELNQVIPFGMKGRGAFLLLSVVL